MVWLESSVFAEAKSDLFESSVFADTLSHIRSSLLCSQIRYLAYQRSLCVTRLSYDRMNFVAVTGWPGADRRRRRVRDS